jgi:phosphoribosylcarboxyaminoimidazole (NCAIR) mutase
MSDAGANFCDKAKVEFHVNYVSAGRTTEMILALLEANKNKKTISVMLFTLL